MEAEVRLRGMPVGLLTKERGQYRFQYFSDYVALKGQSISLSLPVREDPYLSETGLHGYFSGLLSEGWLRHAQSRIEHIDEHDEFTLLLRNGLDLPGQIQVISLDREATKP